MGQHPHDLKGKHAQSSTRPPRLSSHFPSLLQGLPLIRHSLGGGCEMHPVIEISKFAKALYSAKKKTLFIGV